MCKFFMVGECTRGEQCKFSHAKSNALSEPAEVPSARTPPTVHGGDDRPSNGVPQVQVTHARDMKFRTSMCKFFQAGLCSRGASCSFAHSPSQLQPEVDITKTRLCFAFVQDGKCAKGSRCTFAHGKQELCPIDRNRRKADNAAAVATAQLEGISLGPSPRELAARSDTDGSFFSGVDGESLFSMFVPPTRKTNDVWTNNSFTTPIDGLRWQEESLTMKKPMTVPSQVGAYGISAAEQGYAFQGPYPPILHQPLHGQHSHSIPRQAQWVGESLTPQ